MWAEKSIFYQIYPLNFCAGAKENPSVYKLTEWIDHIKDLGCDAVYFNPIFESDFHGYDTKDFSKIDARLGDNAAFATVSKLFHDKGIRIILDGVFNHVGRGFWAFEDVKKNKWDSKYRDWFFIDFNGNSGYNDGFWYEGWEGHFELVKLNLHNGELRRYLIDRVKDWMKEFGIDGLRLDVAYSLDDDFIKQLSWESKQINPEFFLMGEMLHGDYNRKVQSGMLDSCTNYECYKGLYSSFNSKNLFEIAHSLMRQFGKENWTLYKGKHLCNFVDNHDVTRIASILNDRRDLFPLYTILYFMPGIPFIYYGSEWGAEGVKTAGSDDVLRPSFEAPKQNELVKHLAELARLRKNSQAVLYGDFETKELTNLQFIFSRTHNGEQITAAVNIDEKAYAPKQDYGECIYSSDNESAVAAHGFAIWKKQV